MRAALAGLRQWIFFMYLIFDFRRRRRGSVSIKGHLTSAGTCDWETAEKEQTKRSSALSSPMHTTKVKKPIFRLWPAHLQKEVHILFSTFQVIHTNMVAQKQGRDTLVPEAHHVYTVSNISKETDLPTQLGRTCHSLPSPSVTQEAPRIRTSHVLLSTSCISWHNMSSSKLPLPPSSFEGRRAIVSPDPCSPMTNSASLSTLFSPELLDDTEEPLSDQVFSSAIICKPIEAHAFTFSAEMLGPN